MTAKKDPSELTIRLSPELGERLRQAAKERMVSPSLIATKAVEQFLDRLIPMDQVAWTRDD